MKMTHAVFALHGKTAFIVIAGIQPSLYRLADANVFLLDLIAEVNGRLRYFRRTAFSSVSEPFEDSQSLVVPVRENDVTTEVVRVNIQHEIRKQPIVQRALAVVGKLIPARRASFFSVSANGSD